MEVDDKDEKKKKEVSKSQQIFFLFKKNLRKKLKVTAHLTSQQLGQLWLSISHHDRVRPDFNLRDCWKVFTSTTKVLPKKYNLMYNYLVRLRTFRISFYALIRTWNLMSINWQTLKTQHFFWWWGSFLLIYLSIFSMLHWDQSVSNTKY